MNITGNNAANCRDSSWSLGIPRLLKKLNNFLDPGSSRDHCVPLVVCGEQVGILLPKLVEKLKTYPDTFQVLSNGNDRITHVEFHPSLDNYKSRSNAVLAVVKDMKGKDDFETLQYWRNEDYEVSSAPSRPAVFKIERAATSLFGVRTYGSHMNGYIRHPTKGICLWIAKRSATKETYPGMLDNMVAGGVSVGYGITETMVKECHEEAGIPESIARGVLPVGCISYIYENSRGVNAEVQFCFDLELPIDFVPTPVDGEVENFMLCDVSETKKLIVQDDFKANCAAVILDFLIRFGFVTPDNEPLYCEIIQGLHNDRLSI